MRGQAPNASYADKAAKRKAEQEAAEREAS